MSRIYTKMVASFWDIWGQNLGFFYFVPSFLSQLCPKMEPRNFYIKRRFGSYVSVYFLLLHRSEENTRNSQNQYAAKDS